MKDFVRLNKNEMKMVMGGTVPVDEIEGGLGTCKAKCKTGSVECEGKNCTPVDYDSATSLNGYCSYDGQTRWC